MQNQSYRQVFVTNSGTLLAASKTTADLTDGQIGILSDSYGSIAYGSLDYDTNKSIYIAHGTPDLSSFPTMAGIPNQTEMSKLIVGSKVTKWRGKKAASGQTMIVTVGYDGTDTTKNLSAKVNETKYVYIKLTGEPVNRIYSTQGIVLRYAAWTGCPDDCGDNCDDVDPSDIADTLVAAINADTKGHKGLIKATKLTGTDSSSNEVAGVKIETAYVKRKTTDCTYGYFDVAADVPHIQVSEYDPNYNSSPCQGNWPVTVTQEITYAVGTPEWVREQEINSLSYVLQERSMDPGVREAEGYELQTDMANTYDELTIGYDIDYKVGGFSQTYHDSYELTIYFKSGTATNFLSAMNAWVTAANPALSSVSLS